MIYFELPKPNDEACIFFYERYSKMTFLRMLFTFDAFFIKDAIEKYPLKEIDENDKCILN